MKQIIGLALALWLCPTILLAQQPVVLQGQVACAQCWHEADRNVTPYGTKADFDCAVACFNQGVGGVLAVKTDQSTTLYQLVNGKFKKSAKGWLPYMAKQVEVSGTLREKKGRHLLSVDSLKVIQEVSPPSK